MNGRRMSILPVALDLLAWLDGVSMTARQRVFRKRRVPGLFGPDGDAKRAHFEFEAPGASSFLEMAPITPPDNVLDEMFLSPPFKVFS